MSDPIAASLRFASDGMEAQSARLRMTHQNLSNVDTPGYQRKLVTFTTGADDKAVRVDRVTLDETDPRIILDPAHPLADADGYVTMSNVDMFVEMTDAREAKRNFEANLEAFRQAREMYSGLIGLLRR